MAISLTDLIQHVDHMLHIKGLETTNPLRSLLSTAKTLPEFLVRHYIRNSGMFPASFHAFVLLCEETAGQEISFTELEREDLKQHYHAIMQDCGLGVADDSPNGGSGGDHLP